MLVSQKADSVTKHFVGCQSHCRHEEALGINQNKKWRRQLKNNLIAKWQKSRIAAYWVFAGLNHSSHLPTIVNILNLQQLEHQDNSIEQFTSRTLFKYKTEGSLRGNKPAGFRSLSSIIMPPAVQRFDQRCSWLDSLSAMVEAKVNKRVFLIII